MTKKTSYSKIFRKKSAWHTRCFSMEQKYQTTHY